MAVGQILYHYLDAGQFLLLSYQTRSIKEQKFKEFLVNNYPENGKNLAVNALILSTSMRSLCLVDAYT